MRKLILFLIFLLASSPVHAYIGPGIGLGVIGLILGIALSILIAIITIFWYPFALLWQKITGRRKKNAAKDTLEEDIPE